MTRDPGERKTLSARDIGALLASILLASCGDDMMSPLPVATRLGARQLPLSGVVFRLGSDDASASPEERPGWTRFAHDVWMDTTEMTQTEYEALLGGNPSPIRGDALPVTNVSWYDAVLAANARSKRDDLDTVYEYIAASSDSTGAVSDLPGISIHLDRSGWRLPTEAEWEAASRAGTSTAWPWGARSDSVHANDHAWYAGNSGGAAHAVATKSPNAWGLYDMSGNVMEWVNDWKGTFPADTVEEFAGQESPGDVAEVPLKGGAYNYGLSQLRPSNRVATYAAYRSARAEYVGFRLARGGLTARYMSATGSITYTPPVALEFANVARLLGAWDAHLVFVNRANGKGTLTWIDYGEATPVARSLPDSNPVFHPVISPDGQWVAWSTTLEGSTASGRIRARRLAKNDTVVLDLGEGAIPRWWASGADTFLIRSEALDNTSPSWSVTKTLAQRWSNGSLTGAVETWASSGSYHDGRSGPYLYTGYRRLRQYDLRTGSDRILFTGPQNGKASGDTSQVCNVSASPDSSGRSLFLDFGYGGTSSVVGRSYGIHEIAFVSDSAGKVIGQIPTPMGESQWEHMEWSNASRWAVSGAINGVGAYRNLYLVDLENAPSTKLVSGTELWQPALWVGETTTVPDGWVDSLGRYDIPQVVEGYQQEMAHKLVMALKQIDQIEIAALGSSRTYTGIDPLSFSSGKAWNLASETGVQALSDTIIFRYLLPYARNLKAVVVDLHLGWLMTRQCDGTCKGLVESKGYRFDRDHPAEVPSSRSYQTTLASRSWFVGSFCDERGGVSLEDRSWGDATPTALFPLMLGDDQDTGNAVWKSNLAALDRTASALEARGIVFLVVLPPQSPAYRNIAYAGLTEPRWEVQEMLLQQFRAMMARHANAIFYDAYQNGNHDYLSNEFLNESHLTTSGAKKLSRRVDSILAAYWAKD